MHLAALASRPAAPSLAVARRAARAAQRLAPQSASFATTAPLLARKKNQQKKDHRVTEIRYHLHHPITPRPLRFSRLRALRHWTIHRAWQLFQAKLRDKQQTELARQYMSMRNACEALRLTGEDGLSITEPGKAVPPIGARDVKQVEVDVERTDESGKKVTEKVQIDVEAAASRQTEVGRLYRIAMEKKGVWQGVPLEYARFQTDTPPRDGWNASWTKGP